MSIKPKLGIFDLTMIVVSLVIGMGIFRTPVNVARETNDPALFFGIWVVGGIVSICGALTYAEIGSRYPVAGGFYKVLSNFYHPAYGFMINWMLLISNAASVAAVCLIGAEYISPVLLPDSLQNDIGQKLVCVAAVLLLYGINMIGIRMSVTWLNVLTVIKIGMMVLLCLAVFSSGHPANAAPVQVVQAERSWLYIFGAALVPVFFTFGGYQQTINFGSDVKIPGATCRAVFFMALRSLWCCILLSTMPIIK
ncbi:APC family permease [Chitinophaga sedimenti]|uniref:APC family permease n=1 Tax=Chitinophaga sedimenti TaxID=2033606 RepID=UPI00249DBA84|nr:amino acid permease [Chitinophaga sedimenti]